MGWGLLIGCTYSAGSAQNNLGNYGHKIIQELQCTKTRNSQKNARPCTLLSWCYLLMLSLLPSMFPMKSSTPDPGKSPATVVMEPLGLCFKPNCEQNWFIFYTEQLLHLGEFPAFYASLNHGRHKNIMLSIRVFN